MLNQHSPKLQTIHDFWHGWYCRIIPTIFTIACGCILWLGKIDLTSGKSFSDLLTAALTGASILTGFMAALLGLVIQNRDTSPTIKRFFKIAQPSGERKFIKLLKHGILSGFIILLLSGTLFLLSEMPTIRQIMFLLWVWVAIYFGASTYRFLALFLSMLLTTAVPVEKQEATKLSEQESADLKNRIPKSKK